MSRSIGRVTGLPDRLRKTPPPPPGIHRWLRPEGPQQKARWPLPPLPHHIQPVRSLPHYTKYPGVSRFTIDTKTTLKTVSAPSGTVWHRLTSLSHYPESRDHVRYGLCTGICSKSEVLFSSLRPLLSWLRVAYGPVYVP